ncbi:hypothetical protein [Candidatus Nitrosotenuis uzonensis]|uniref:Uncharacterized protein n=1 Tax=Candidatus Nitrosotenuis uzonensis TaxID=1407055 RepID=A0A812EV51_9ARCH|nr:hypothetical protein [Candidatus Nitrosotenuis uzonensis]CAE6492363.1 conserved exported hypothetical protein [Candidatus Nitrosotenuis uzonensis]
MRRIYIMVACAMTAYFTMTTLVLPESYQNMHTSIPEPRIDVALSHSTVTLGQSFEISTVSYNDGDDADLQLVSVAFPQSKDLDGIKIISYDFLQSPHLIEIGKEIGSQYAGGAKTVKSQYPSIEAYSRPSKKGDTFTMTIQVTPKEIGTFHIYTKSVAMPHTSEFAHFPSHGIIDHQGEFVQQHTVEVIP